MGFLVKRKVRWSWYLFMNGNKNKNNLQSMVDAIADKTQTQIADLPRCLMVDILSRLPIKTLVKCRCVSKTWLLLFSDPLFVQLQLAKSPTCILSQYISLTKRRVYFWWVVEDEELVVVDDDDGVNSRSSSFRFEKAAIEFPIPPTVGLNSCNGLFCLTEAPERCSNRVWVCNPILGQWIAINPPNAHPQSNPGRSSYALGFSPKSNEYKLLCVLCPEMVDDDEYFTSIYTLGTRQWRSLNREVLGKFREFTSWFNTCVNGSVLHSICYDMSREVHYISSFNFENEMFGTLPLPPSHPNVHLQLAVLNGCLSVSVDHEDGENLQIWSMKEYGVEKSWTLMLVIITGSVPNDDLLLSRDDKKEILMYKSDLRGIDYELLFSLNEEEILMLSVSSSPLVCYNTKRRRCRYPKMPEDYDIWVTAYNPSFVSLHDVAAEEQVMVQSW